MSWLVILLEEANIISKILDISIIKYCQRRQALNKEQETGWPWVKLSVTAFTISVLLQKTYMITTQYDTIDTTLRYDFFLMTGDIWESGCPK